MQPDDLIEAIESIRCNNSQVDGGEGTNGSFEPLGDLLVILNEQAPFKELARISIIALALGNSLTFSVRNIANRAQYDALMQAIPKKFHQYVSVCEENLLARVSNRAHNCVVIHPSHPNSDQYIERIAKREGEVISIIEYDETVLLAENLTWYMTHLSDEGR